MRLSNSFKNAIHLYNRAGFGCSFKSAVHESEHSVEKMVKNFVSSSTAIKPLNTVSFSYPDEFKSFSEEQRKLVQRDKEQQKQDLNIAWIKRFEDPQCQLRERLTLFWHGHLACREDNPMLMQELNNIQRTFALEPFKDLLLAVSKSSAMLDFLNNQQNKKGHPNENFAREVMELFTIGHGNYTEQDVKESARAFTGWQHDSCAVFHFNEKQHDAGMKTFMGKTGNFRGEDIIDILLTRPETARFLATKIYIYLVNEIPDPAHITELADLYFASGYNTGELVTYILNAAWFYEPRNQGVKIKSPVEFIAILNTTFQVTYADPKVLFYLQQLLGQTLFNPPNVSGWTGGRAWIDTSSILYRMKIPSLILNSGEIKFQGKHDPEEEAAIALLKKNPTAMQRKISASIDWGTFLASIPDPVSQSALISYLLPAGLNIRQRDALLTVNRSDLKGLIIELISTPEYQLN